VGRLDYELTEDDYLAFNQHAAVAAPALVAQSRRARLLWTVVIPLALGVGLWILERDAALAVIAAAIAAGTLWFTWPYFLRRSVTARLRRLAATTGLGRTGATTLVWDDHGITESAASSRASVGWERLDRVEETPRHLFLFVGPLEGLIVPKRAGGEVAELARYARERIPPG